MKWRKWNNIIHRDLGYLCVGLTIIYAVSGVAVNHVQDWNPNYIIEKQEKQIKPISAVDSISVKTVLDISVLMILESKIITHMTITFLESDY